MTSSSMLAALFGASSLLTSMGICGIDPDQDDPLPRRAAAAGGAGRGGMRRRSNEERRLMHWRGKLAASLVVAATALPATNAGALVLTPFRYREQAQRHCPDDTVVWLDFRKRTYYSADQKLYGYGFQGSFVCLKEAQRSRYRRSLLGLR